MKNTITIFENYKVEIDPMNHTLYKYDQGGEVIKVGKFKDSLTKPKWIELGFYPNLNQCLRRIAFEEASQEKEEDINSYITRLEQVAEKLEGAV